MFSVGAVQLSVTLPVALSVTAMGNEGRDALVLPSLTLMLMFEYVPTSAAVGVPDSSPVELLKLAQLGAFLMLNVKVPPLGSVVVGREAIGIADDDRGLR